MRQKRREETAFYYSGTAAYCNEQWRLKGFVVLFNSNGGCLRSHTFLSEPLQDCSLKCGHGHLEMADHWTSRVSVINSLEIGG